MKNRYIIKITIILLLTFILFFPACSSDTPASPVSLLPGDIIITEVGSGYYINGSRWLEVYNKSSEAVNLSRYKLKTWAYDSSDSKIYLTTFDLPSLTIQPGGYSIIRGKTTDYFTNSDNIVYISSGTKTPYWQSGGFIELLIDGITNDFVRFGAETNIPGTSGNWDVSSAPALPFGAESDFGKSIARDGSNSDTNSGTDWTLTEFATFAGPNDIVSTTDTDSDGIPDESETAPGDTFAGLPLYDWGARIGVRDIFIHINYMDSTDEGVIPREEALQKVVDTFANSGQNIAIHFDVGDLYDNSPGTNVARFDLDDKNHKVPFAEAVTLGIVSGKANLYTYKNNYMDLARKQIFHYLLFGNTQTGSPKGSSGLAELNGNDFMVTLGEWELDSSNTTNTNYLINFQAATIMHELGHNLGLHHGGDVDENYKPNYISIMNYLYQLSGLPTDGVSEGDRYYFDYDPDPYVHGIAFYSDLTNGPDKTTFKLDYSGGTAANINENSITESEGLRWGVDNAIDYNLDSDTTDSGLSMSINSNGGSTDAGITTISDFNDWASLNLLFMREWSGDMSGASIHQETSKNIIFMPNPAQNDFQQIYPEHPLKNVSKRMKKN